MSTTPAISCSAVSMTPAKNVSPVSLTPAINPASPANISLPISMQLQYIWVLHNSCRSEGFTVLTGLHASALHREEFLLLFCSLKVVKQERNSWADAEVWYCEIWTSDIRSQISPRALSLPPYSKKMDDFFSIGLKGLSHEIFREKRGTLCLDYSVRRPFHWRRNLNIFLLSSEWKGCSLNKLINFKPL